MELYKRVTFEAAHRLPNAPAGHKCARLHGHSFALTVFVRGPVDGHAGWVMDFGEIKSKLEPILAQLDHHYLNEIEGLENPTSENIARWVWRRLRASLPQLARVEIAETCTTGCAYQGEDEPDARRS